MTIVYVILLIILCLFIIPFLSFQIAKWLAIGFYRGKEVFRGRLKRDEIERENLSKEKEL